LKPLDHVDSFLKGCATILMEGGTSGLPSQVADVAEEIAVGKSRRNLAKS
jgi:hypothetical protein